MRTLYFTVVLVFCFLGTYAQQEAQYTQFMYNKLTLNPAYAGSAGMPCVSCLHRSQWLGFEGAPTSQVLNFHLPAFSNRVGLGASLTHDQIGPSDSYGLSMMYAYRMKLSKGNLSIGLRGSFHTYQVNYAKLTTIEATDQDIPDQNVLSMIPNFGVGLYYETSKFYAGFSVPSILNTRLTSKSIIGGGEGKINRHFYLMAGYVFSLGDQVKLKPAALAKIAKNTPFDLDINATFIFANKFWTGVSYRMGGDSVYSIGESVDFLVQYQLSPKIRVGAAYDFTLSKVRNHSNGSVEVQIQYCMPQNHVKMTNPRFF